MNATPETSLRLIKIITQLVNVRVAYPLMLVYLVANGHSPSAAGTLITVATIAHLVSDVPLSYLADRASSYHQFLVWGAACAALGFGGLGLWPHSALMTACWMALTGLSFGLIAGNCDAYARHLIHQRPNGRGPKEYEHYIAGRISRTAILQVMTAGVLVTAAAKFFPHQAPRFGILLQASLGLIALWFTLRLQPVALDRQEVHARTNRWRGWQDARWLVIAGAVACGLDNTAGLVGQFRLHQLGASTVMVSVCPAAFWVVVMLANRIVFVAERLLGKRGVAMGSILAISAGILAIVALPLPWLIAGYALIGVGFSIRMAVFANRISQGATNQATALSVCMTLGVGLFSAINLAISWAVAIWPVQLPVIVMLLLVTPVGLIAAWKSRDADRGW